VFCSQLIFWKLTNIFNGREKYFDLQRLSPPPYFGSRAMPPGQMTQAQLFAEKKRLAAEKKKKKEDKAAAAKVAAEAKAAASAAGIVDEPKPKSDCACSGLCV